MSLPNIQSVAVIGLGYVGLPLAKLFTESGLNVIGIEASSRRVESLLAGRSYLNDITDQDLSNMLATQRFKPSVDYSQIESTNGVVICVPTPLTSTGEPDLSFIHSAAESVARHLKPSQFVILESSTFPGTTTDYLIPILESSGLMAGEDFYVAYSPERIDPGSQFDIRNIPKIVGGIDDYSTQLAVSLYQRVFKTTVSVSSPATAELTKLLENTQRLVNISLINEMSIICCKLGVDVWEIINAAASKPYGFTVYYPGPGIGGHCIPVDPLYLQSKLGSLGERSLLIDAATEVNRRMPAYIVERCSELFYVPNPNVLVIGVAYKPNVNDVRESPALEIIKELIDRKVSVSFHDPLVKQIRIRECTLYSIELTEESIIDSDIVVILTDHSNIDYQLIYDHSQLIFDTRNVYSSFPDKSHVIKL